MPILNHRDYITKLADRVEHIEGVKELAIQIPSYYGYQLDTGRSTVGKVVSDVRELHDSSIVLQLSDGEYLNLRRFIASVAPTTPRYFANDQIIDESFIENNVTSDTYRTLMAREYLSTIVNVLKAIADTVYDYTEDITSNVTLPTDEKPLSLVQFRTNTLTTNANVSWVSLLQTPRDFTEIMGDMHFGVRRLASELFTLKMYDLPRHSTRWLAAPLRIMFSDDIEFSVISQATPYPTTADSIPASQFLFFRNSLPRFSYEHLNSLYVSIDGVKRHSTNTMVRCGYSKMYGFYSDPDSQYTYYRSNFVTQPSGFSQPISVVSLQEITEAIRTDQCDECDSFYHIGFGEFTDRVTNADGYSDLEPLFHTTSTAMHSLYEIARAMHPDDEPSSYCYACERGEEDYEDEEEEYGHRYHNLRDSEAEAIGTVATNYNKVLRIQGRYHLFTDTKEAKNDYPYMYEINSYDFRPDLVFINGDDTSKTKLYMGMELEMDGGGELHSKAVPINSALTGNKVHSWTMSDGSLSNGIEIATMPATLDAHMNVFNYDFACNVATALGYRAHDTSTAGMHIHINRNFFGDDKHIQLYRASLMALIMERNWEDFVRFSRRRYNRLDQWAKKKNVASQEYTDRDVDLIVEKTKREYNNGDKYLALNMNRMATFELRIFRGSLKADTIKATLQFVSNLAHYCKYNGLKSAQQATILDIINYTKYPELTAYWEANKNREVS